MTKHKKLIFRWNWQKECWEQQGFFVGDPLKKLRWIAVETNFVQYATAMKVGEIREDLTVPETAEGANA